MISVVIPVYKNAATLVELSRRLDLALAGREYELIFVVDGSPDQSFTLCAGLARESARVKVLDLAQNVGQNRALLAGLSMAQGDIAIFIDADLQDAPEEIPRFLEFLERNPETQAIFAARKTSGGPFLKQLTSRGFKGILRVFSGFRLPAHVGQFVAMRRPLFTQLVEWRDHHVHTLPLIVLAAPAEAGALAAIPTTRGSKEQTGYTPTLRARTAWSSLRTLAAMPAPAAKPVSISNSVNTPPVFPSRSSAPTQLQSRMRLIQTWRTLALLAALTFILRLIASAASGWGTADEAWMLQVTCRTSGAALHDGHRDALYRDLYFNVLPLPVYLSRAWCFVFGYSALALKGLIAAIVTLTFVVTHRLAARLGLVVSPWLLALFMLAMPYPAISSLYNNLATLLVMAGALVVFQWRVCRCVRKAVLVGLIIGACIGAKVTAGAYLSVACALMMLLPAGRHCSWRRRFSHVTITGISAAMLVWLIVLPTLLAGTWHDFVACCFLAKTNYLQLAGISFFSGFGAFPALVRVLPDPDALRALGWAFIFPLTLLAAAGAIWGMLIARSGALWRLAPFSLVLVAGFYPRADAPHVCLAWPAILLTLLLAISSLPLMWRRILSLLGITVASLFLAVSLTSVAHCLMSPDWRFTGLTHLRGVLLRKSQADHLALLAQTLHQQPEPILILSPEASALYLLTGLGNPTPYDYPLANMFAPGAQERIAQDIRSGRIKTVLLYDYRGAFSPFLPRQLYDEVVQYCPLIGTVEECEIRSSPAQQP